MNNSSNNNAAIEVNASLNQCESACKCCKCEAGSCKCSSGCSCCKCSSCSCD